MRRKLVMSLACLLLAAGAAGAQEGKGKVVGELVDVLRDYSGRRSVWVRYQAAETLGKMGPDAAEAVPALARFLDDSRDRDAEVLDEAVVKTLGKIGRAARPAIPALVRISRRNFDLERAAAEAIDRILLTPVGEQQDVPTLLKDLRDRDASVRLRAAKALGTLGPAGKPGIPLLTEALNDPDADVRRQALQALKAIDPTAKPGEPEINVFIRDLQDPDPAVRLRAAKALGRIGPDAAPALPALLEASHDEDPDVRRVATEALAKIQPR
jgi:HEAT repeat protein